MTSLYINQYQTKQSATSNTIQHALSKKFSKFQSYHLVTYSNLRVLFFQNTTYLGFFTGVQGVET